MLTPEDMQFIQNLFLSFERKMRWQFDRIHTDFGYPDEQIPSFSQIDRMKERRENSTALSGLSRRQEDIEARLRKLEGKAE
jgi:hypothetical protein